MSICICTSHNFLRAVAILLVSVPYMYIYIYVYVHVYMYICIHAHTYIYIYEIFIHVHTHACAFIGSCAYMYTFTYIHIHAYMYEKRTACLYRQAYMHAHLHLCIHMYLYVCMNKRKEIERCAVHMGECEYLCYDGLDERKHHDCVRTAVAGAVGRFRWRVRPSAVRVRRWSSGNWQRWRRSRPPSRKCSRSSSSSHVQQLRQHRLRGSTPAPLPMPMFSSTTLQRGPLLMTPCIPHSSPKRLRSTLRTFILWVV